MRSQLISQLSSINFWRSNMSNHTACYSNIKDRTVVFEENRSRMIFNNPLCSSLTKVKVDGCIPLPGVKCDFLLICSKGVEHFVELKGSDVNHAALQLSTTISALSQDPKKHPKHSFVVSTRCPLSSPQVQLIQKRFRKDYNSSFRIKNKQAQHDL